MKRKQITIALGLIVIGLLAVTALTSNPPAWAKTPDTIIVDFINSWGSSSNSTLRAKTTYSAGENLVVAGGNTELVSNQSANPTQPATEYVAVIVSGSANDDRTGTGVKKVTVYGVDLACAAISEDIEMDGTSNVSTTDKFLRIDRLVAEWTGSGGKAAGAITAKLNTNTVAQINTGENESQMAYSTVATGAAGYVTDWECSSDGDIICTLAYRVLLANPTIPLKHELARVDISNQAYSRNFPVPLRVPQCSEVFVEAYSENALSSSPATAAVSIYRR